MLLLCDARLFERVEVPPIYVAIRIYSVVLQKKKQENNPFIYLETVSRTHTCAFQPQRFDS